MLIAERVPNPHLIAPPVIDPVVTPDKGAIDGVDHAPTYNVLIHNDPITTFEYVITILGDIFMLSFEMAEHIALTAHEQGTAVVVVRPKPEAKHLSDKAKGQARIDGWPLTFSIEPSD